MCEYVALSLSLNFYCFILGKAAVYLPFHITRTKTRHWTSEWNKSYNFYQRGEMWKRIRQKCWICDILKQNFRNIHVFCCCCPHPLKVTLDRYYVSVSMFNITNHLFYRSVLLNTNKILDVRLSLNLVISKKNKVPVYCSIKECVPNVTGK